MSAIPKIMPFSDLRIRQAEVLSLLEDEPIILAQRGRPAAVLVSLDRWNHLMRELEDLQDALDLVEARRTAEGFVEFEDYLATRGESVPAQA